MPYLRNIELKPKYNIQENSYNDINFEKRSNMFKGTIIICVVYGIFAFLLMASTAFSRSSRVLLFDNFLPFTLVFIIGTILIICLMLYYIFSYIPVNITYRLDGITCPDYWDVELLDDNYIKNSFDPQYPSSYFKYKCVMNKDIFDTKKMFIDSSNLVSDTTKAYKYTNILTGINPATASYNGNEGSYSLNSNTQFDKEIKNYKQYSKLYKDVNQYQPNNIKNFINSSSDTISSNIFNNLKNIAMVQNNYKVINPKYNTDNITDIILSNNIWNSTSTSVSPIIWNYNTSTTNSVGIGTTTRLEVPGVNSTISAVILDWKDLTAEKAFYSGYDLSLNSNDDSNSIKKGLNIYYKPTTTTTYLNLLGKVEITSNPLNNPTISMKFIPNVKGLFTANDNDNSLNDYILNSDNIIISKETKNDTNLNINSANKYINLLQSEVRSTMTITNKPIIQLYNTSQTRPSSISKTDLDNHPIPLSCDELYPSFLESMDDDNNNVRCAYSKICSFPWSDLRCPLQKKSQTQSYYTAP
jgi:hypothetical protein